MGRFTFHHIGVAVADVKSATSVYGKLFDYKLVDGPFDDPIQKVSVCFLRRDTKVDTTLELVAPLGQGSPVDRTLKKGGGIYHVCYEVQDINKAIAHLVKHGSFLISGPVPAVAFGMREIAWLMADSNLLVELLQA